MKLIIAGSRNFTDYETLRDVVNGIIQKHNLNITEIVSGKARGADTLGEQFAEEYGIPVKEFPADWNTHGRAAGPIRNQQMADYGDILVAFPEGNGKGTQNMIKTMKKMNKSCFVYHYETGKQEESGIQMRL